MNFRRIAAGFSAIVLGFGCLASCAPAPLGAPAPDRDAVQTVQRSDPEKPGFDAQTQLMSENSLGGYLTELTEGSTEPREETAQYAAGTFLIGEIGFDPQSGIATVYSTQTLPCTVEVSLLSDPEGACLTTASAQVQPDEEEVLTQVQLDAACLPEFYYLSAQLLDLFGNPLCAPFTLTTHTRQMREVMEAQISDFPEEQVINLDDSEKTNFLVVSEDTVIADTTGDANALVSADYDSNTFVFEHPDEALCALTPGQPFFAQSGEDIIAVEIVSAETDGDTLILKGDDTNIADILDVIKIEASADLSDAEVEPGECVTDEFTLKRVADDDSEVQLERGVSLDFPVKFGEHVEATVSFGLTMEISFYKYFGYTNVDISIKMPVTISAQVKAEKNVDLTQPFAYICVPTGVPGLLVRFEPKFVLEAKAKVEFKYAVTPKIGFSYDSDTDSMPQFYHSLDRDNGKATFKIEGEVFVGVSINPTICIINDKIVSAELEGKVGVKLTATLVELTVQDGDAESNVLIVADTSEDSIHCCEGFCIEGDCSFVFEVNFKLTVLLIELKANVATVTIPLFDWYFSPTVGFGLGECPNRAYKLTVNVKDEAGNPCAGVTTDIDGQSLTTGSGGQSVFYCARGSHVLTIRDEYGYAAYTQRFYINSRKKTIDIIRSENGSITSPQAPTEPEETTVNEQYMEITEEFTSPVPEELQVWETGTIGESDVHYIFYKNGFLYIYGTGEIPDFPATGSYNTGYSPFNHDYGTFKVFYDPDYYNMSRDILEVYIENSDPDNPITRIGNSVFDSCVNLEYVSMPDTVTSIGERAFNRCYSLKDIHFSQSLQSIETSAFSECESLDVANLPDSVTGIGDYAFHGCSGLQTLHLPENDGCKVGQSAFASSGIRKLVLPSNITYYDEEPSDPEPGNNMFNNCQNLESVEVAPGLPALSASMFSYCKNLKNVTLPDNMQTIASSAFYSCTSLTGICLPSSLQKIGSAAFSECESLTDITIPDTVTELGEYNALYNESYGGCFRGCKSLTNVTLPESVHTIRESCFQECSSLRSVTIYNREAEIASNSSYWNQYTFPYGTVIYGYRGSTAQSFASSNSYYYGYYFVALDGDSDVRGDVNNDTIADATDIALLERHVTGPGFLTGNVLVNADVDGDGAVNVIDLAALKMQVRLEREYVNRAYDCERGDINMDGVIDVQDADLLERYLELSSKDVLTRHGNDSYNYDYFYYTYEDFKIYEAQIDLMDVYRDYTVDENDLTALREKIAG
ncbi:MAG: leucine-rich repeat protein [Oscillospiraceae bacterium]|nr:leucine-rich repeat protein [Oscillospiraceae bacterium]